MEEPKKNASGYIIIPDTEVIRHEPPLTLEEFKTELAKRGGKIIDHLQVDMKP